MISSCNCLSISRTLFSLFICYILLGLSIALYPLRFINCCFRYPLQRIKIILVDNKINRPQLSIAHLDPRVFEDNLLDYWLFQCLFRAVEHHQFWGFHDAFLAPHVVAVVVEWCLLDEGDGCWRLGYHRFWSLGYYWFWRWLLWLFGVFFGRLADRRTLQELF